MVKSRGWLNLWLLWALSMNAGYIPEQLLPVSCALARRSLWKLLCIFWFPPVFSCWPHDTWLALGLPSHTILLCRETVCSLLQCLDSAYLWLFQCWCQLVTDYPWRSQDCAWMSPAIMLGEKTFSLFWESHSVGMGHLVPLKYWDYRCVQSHWSGIFFFFASSTGDRGPC